MEFPVANLEVTRTACSQKFSANGREVPENQEHPAEKKMRDLMQHVQEQYMNKSEIVIMLDCRNLKWWKLKRVVVNGGFCNATKKNRKLILVYDTSF